jgi:hypothetical protein
MGDSTEQQHKGAIAEFSRLWRENPVPILALAISLFSFVISALSFTVTLRGSSISGTQFQQERQLVLAGTFKTKMGIAVAPIDSAMRFLEGTAYFPPQIFSYPVPVNGNGEFLRMGAVQAALERYIEKMVPKENGYARVSQGEKIPIIISSYYAVKGDSYTDVSLYLMGVDFVVLDEPSKGPDLTPVSLSFGQHLPANQPIKVGFLDELIASPSGYNIKPKTP